MLLPQDIQDKYEVHESRNGLAVLKGACDTEYEEILKVLRAFTLLSSDIRAPGGSKSPIAKKLDGHFYQLGWEEKSFDTRIFVDETEMISPTHGVDCFKGKVALEVEWNNKDPFYDRDLNNFRLLFDLRAIDVGVIVTRSDELQEIFNELGKGSSSLSDLGHCLCC